MYVSIFQFFDINEEVLRISNVDVPGMGRRVNAAYVFIPSLPFIDHTIAHLQSTKGVELQTIQAYDAKSKDSKNRVETTPKTVGALSEAYCAPEKESAMDVLKRG